MIELVLNECDVFQFKYGLFDVFIFNHPLRKTYYEHPEEEYLKPYERAYLAFDINYN